MTDSISFIHAADLHLDSPFKGLTNIPPTLFKDVRESTFTALDNLVQTAIIKQVDFILLVGDLFDNDKQSLKAQVKLRTAFETLQENEIDVFLSYGNHDHILGNPYRLPFPDNVHVFSSEEVEQLVYKKNNNEALAAIYGFSYHKRAVQTNKTSEYNIKNYDIPFHIATLHGSLHGNKAHDPYAPFTLQELQEKSFDYWALGHIHERAELSSEPLIIYPGNTQGRHRNETGDKGCYYVKMTPTSTTYDFITLQTIQFIEQKIDISSCETIHELEQTILSKVEPAEQKQLLHLTLFSDNHHQLNFHDEAMMTELIEIINDTLIDQANWQFIYTYHLDIAKPTTIAMEEKFVHELEQAMENLDVNETLADLFQHATARKYIREVDIETVKREADNKLLYDLLQKKERDPS